MENRLQDRLLTTVSHREGDRMLLDDLPLAYAQVSVPPLSELRTHSRRGDKLPAWTPLDERESAVAVQHAYFR